ncbi:hypothetical protein TWF751_012037 [Orbilia oligospora]|nr:hypothetical protein TWF751_012037 [Orbilia oligospora]
MDMSIGGGLPFPLDMMQGYRGIRSLSTIYIDPLWPEILHQIFETICPLKSQSQSSKNSEIRDLWYTCRSVCKTWKTIIETPLLINPSIEKQKLIVSTFRGGLFATVDDNVFYCALGTDWIQQKIIREVEEQKLTPPSPTRRFGLRCHTEFRLLWRNSSVLQMYASTPVVKDVRIRSFIREVEVTQRKQFLQTKGFNIPGAKIIREWDGWHLNAPGGVMIDMMVGFVALAVEIDVLMQNVSERESIGTPRPRFLDLEFLHIDFGTARALGARRFEIPMVRGQLVSGGNEMSDLWRNLLEVVNAGSSSSPYASGDDAGGKGGKDFEEVFERLKSDWRASEEEEEERGEEEDNDDDDERVDKYHGRKKGQGRRR